MKIAALSIGWLACVTLSTDAGQWLALVALTIAARLAGLV